MIIWFSFYVKSVWRSELSTVWCFAYIVFEDKIACFILKKIFCSGFCDFLKFSVDEKFRINKSKFHFIRGVGISDRFHFPLLETLMKKKSQFFLRKTYVLSAYKSPKKTKQNKNVTTNQQKKNRYANKTNREIIWSKRQKINKKPTEFYLICINHAKVKYINKIKETRAGAQRNFFFQEQNKSSCFHL